MTILFIYAKQSPLQVTSSITMEATIKISKIHLTVDFNFAPSILLHELYIDLGLSTTLEQKDPETNKITLRTSEKEGYQIN